MFRCGPLNIHEMSSIGATELTGYPNGKGLLLTGRIFSVCTHPQFACILFFFIKLNFFFYFSKFNSYISSLGPNLDVSNLSSKFVFIFFLIFIWKKNHF